MEPEVPDSKRFIEAFYELYLLEKDYPILEDWQLISRVAHIIYLFMRDGEMYGVDGRVKARQYILEALRRIGVNRLHYYRAYLHGLRPEVLETLEEIFPNLVPIKRPYSVSSMLSYEISVSKPSVMRREEPKTSNETYNYYREYDVPVKVKSHSETLNNIKSILKEFALFFAICTAIALLVILYVR